MVCRTAPQSKTDKEAWPVTIRVLIPERGLIALGHDNDVFYWLRDRIGLGEYAETSLTTALGDAVALHFRCIEDAAALLARFPQLVLADSTMACTYSSPHWPFGCREVQPVCTLYNHTRAVDAMRQVFAPQPLDTRASNGAPTDDIYPNRTAVVVRGGDGGYATENARFGLPTPPQYRVGKRVDPGVTNVRNTRSPHWRQWLGPANRCLVPFDRFAEPSAEGGNVWFELVPPATGFFAGILVRDWTSVRRLADGPTTDTLFGFLTTEPNALVRAHHPKAMPVILTTQNEWDTWLNAPWEVAKLVQRPLAEGLLRVVSP